MTLLQKTPDIAVQLSEGDWYGWLFRKHPDGQWVSSRKLCDLEIIQIEHQIEKGHVIHGPNTRIA